MNLENKEDTKLVETKDVGQLVDKSRRSFSKTGVMAPVIMTLASKTALGDSYYCTISGMQSGNTSSHTGGYTCSVGFSPGAWWQNADKTGDSDGNITQWLLAGVVPFTIEKEDATTQTTTTETKTTVTCQVTQTDRHGNPKKWLKTTTIETWINGVHQLPDNVTPKYNQNSCSISGPTSLTTTETTTTPAKKFIFKNGVRVENAAIYDLIAAAKGEAAQATTFGSVFGGTSNSPLWDILDTNNGSLEWHAIADYLNAKLNKENRIFNPVYADITPEYIVGIYQDLSISDDDKKDYFILIHHPSP